MGVFWLLTLSVLAGGCGNGSSAVEAKDAWARPSPPVGNTAAFYVTISNSSGVDDRLIAASSPWCQEAELHQTVLTGDVTSMPAADTELMRVSDGGTLDLEPNGLHIMCLGVKEPLVEGQELLLHLELAEAGSIEAKVRVSSR